MIASRHNDDTVISARRCAKTPRLCSPRGKSSPDDVDYKTKESEKDSGAGKPGFAQTAFRDTTALIACMNVTHTTRFYRRFLAMQNMTRN